MTWPSQQTTHLQVEQMSATGHEAQFPPLERRGLRVPVLQYVSAGVGGLAVLCLFPEAKSRDFADLWPPDVIVSEMTATGFTGVEPERRHVHRERDLAGLWSAVGSASGT